MRRMEEISALRSSFAISAIRCDYLITSLTYLLLMMPYGLTQHDDNLHIVSPTPALRQQEQAITTVILVSNELNDSNRRFHSLRPEVGLVTSTARTFIQNGVTTEYATQVVGTTLDNGRVYAQYLKKSSRVLYENDHVPTVVTSWVGDSTILPQSHNDVYNADRPEWQDREDRLRKAFVANTDFGGALYDSHEKSTTSPALTVTPVLTSSQQLSENQKGNEINDVHPNVGTEKDLKKLVVQKVLPIADLPTYTVKNHYSPSGFSSGDPTQNNTVKRPFKAFSEARTPKLYYQLLMKGRGGGYENSEPQLTASYIPENLQERKLGTTTYYGFADFTTIVGDSVIVFSPSSSMQQNHLGQVTSIKGEATLGEIKTSQMSYTSVTEDIILPTPTQDNEMPLTIPSLEEESAAHPSIGSTETVDYEKDVTINVPTEIKESAIHEEKSTIQVSKSSSVFNSPATLSLPSDEEISAIFSMLQQKDKTLSASKEDEQYSNSQTSQIVEPSPTVHTEAGATTVFFEEDPFANFVVPTSSLIDESVTEAGNNGSPALNATDILQGNTSSTESFISMNDFSQTIISPSEKETSVVESRLTSIVRSTEFVQENKTPSLYPTTTLQSGIIVRELLDTESELFDKCSGTSQVFLTQLPKLVTYFTTYFTSGKDESSNIKSVETNIVNTFNIKETTKKYCIQSTSTLLSSSEIVRTQEPFEGLNQHVPLATVEMKADIEEQTATEEGEYDTTTLSSNSEDDFTSDEAPIEDEEEDSEEEFELLFKTLYTTYTYLTTIFQESSSNILSHTEVVTSVITSTIGDIEPSLTESFNTDLSTVSVENKLNALNNLDSLIKEEEGSLENKDNEHNTIQITSTEQSDHVEINTFETTYTYFTTIFAEGETEIISRTEVLTNVITKTPSKTTITSAATPATDLRNSNFIVPSIDVFSSGNIEETAPSSVKSSQNLVNYSTLVRNGTVPEQGLGFEVEDSSAVKVITDVRSSSSSGEGHVINGIVRPQNDSQHESQHIDDQISSESNNEEIVPSATLLLQTSFTTFTYYTTMYNNNDTNVISRLETVTNVVTETLKDSAKQTSVIQEPTLPVTYYTTFTYWTKLAKDGIVSTLSREETITNVVTPTSVQADDTAPTVLTTLFFNNTDSTHLSSITPSTHEAATVIQETSLEPTTYYTTYTYYTTSYQSDSTITNSRLETITNVLSPTAPLTLGEISTVRVNTSDTDHNLAEKKEFLLFDYKNIYDADGISTLFFETQVLPSVNEAGVPVEVTRSSSSLYIDEAKKSSIVPIMPSLTVNSEGSTVPVRQYKTGLVRLIDGTRIGNHTTTLYQSRVIGTLIENRYAQIIESTSSFLFERTSSSLADIVPTKSENFLILSTDVNLMAPSIDAIESSTGHSTDTEETRDDDENVHHEDEDEEDEEDDKNNARFPFQQKKRKFSPVIRPFADRNRNRPQFAPKKKIGIASSATIITRSDFTPTITATPALKSGVRYTSSRKISGSSSINAFGSSSRRFSRPGKPSPTANQISSTGGTAPNSRSRFGVSLRSSGTLNASTKRLVSPSRSSLPGFRPGYSSGFNSNSRFRIKPTSAFVAGQSTNPSDSIPTSASDPEDGEEENSTQETATEEDTDNSRKNQNNLLRYRRPLTRPGAGNLGSLVSTRRNPLTARPKATTSTTTSTTVKPRPRGFQRPAISALPGRQRPQSSLFPPRGLFQAQKPDDPSLSINTDSESSTTTESSDGDDDGDYDEEDGDESEDDSSDRKRRSSSKSFKKILEEGASAFKRKSRSKRDADVSHPSRKNFRSRFRQSKTDSAAEEERKSLHEDILENTTQQPSTRHGRVNSRFGIKHRVPSSSTTAVAVSHRAIRPTRPNSGRSQFTLREKDTSTTTKSYQRHNSGSFRRPQTASSTRRTPTPISNNRRLKAFTNNNIGTETVQQRSSNKGTRMRSSNANSGRSRPSNSRGRNRNEFNMELISNTYDGVITVTHVIPSEVTIPVVNGQLTEFKNVITAKTSSEVVSPQEYTSFVGSNGQTTLALTREESMTNIAGATEITKFILHGSPTSTITFTPTTIRGRKTSFSHILPSTAYSVEKLVSTMQPQLSNAPLANILLSQLLLGNIGLPGQVPGNPLLGALGSQPQITSQTPLSPITDYRTHTSTYVTTIFEGMSTVLPVTFQGKKILTTVYDTTAQTITATEFITDTIVTTPTQQVSQQAQLNSLLLQQLLLQQQIQPQFNTKDIPSQNSIKEFLSPETSLQELDSNNLQDREEDIEIPTVEESQLQRSNTKKKSRKPGKSGHRRNKSQVTPSVAETSIITLYVSGRRPGEFSTILSTVQANAESSLQKREADIIVEKTLAFDNENDFYEADGSDIISAYSLLPESLEHLKYAASIKYGGSPNLSLNLLENESDNSEQTQTLESIVGDVSLWMAKSSTLTNMKPKTTNFATQYDPHKNLNFLE